MKYISMRRLTWVMTLCTAVSSFGEMKAFGVSSVAAVCLTTLSAALSPIPADDSLLAKRAPVDAAEVEGTIFERGYHHGKHRQSTI